MYLMDYSTANRTLSPPIYDYFSFSSIADTNDRHKVFLGSRGIMGGHLCVLGNSNRAVSLSTARRFVFSAPLIYE